MCRVVGHWFEGLSHGSFSAATGGRSSNGRTPDSGSGYPGSNPGLPSQSFQSLILINRFVSPEGHDPGSRTDGIAVGANCFYGFTSVPGVHLFQNAMDVISYCKLRKIEARSNFFIRETFGDESNQFLLTQSKIGPRNSVLDGQLPDHLSDETE